MNSKIIVVQLAVSEEKIFELRLQRLETVTNIKPLNKHWNNYWKYVNQIKSLMKSNEMTEV